MSGVVDSGREIGHGNIDANDPNRSYGWLINGLKRREFIFGARGERGLLAFTDRRLEWRTASVFRKVILTRNTSFSFDRCC
jgi:hypothetical protein